MRAELVRWRPFPVPLALVAESADGGPCDMVRLVPEGKVVQMFSVGPDGRLIVHGMYEKGGRIVRKPRPIDAVLKLMHLGGPELGILPGLQILEDHLERIIVEPAEITAVRSHEAGFRPAPHDVEQIEMIELGASGSRLEP